MNASEMTVTIETRSRLFRFILRATVYLRWLGLPRRYTVALSAWAADRMRYRVVGPGGRRSEWKALGIGDKVRSALEAS